MKPINIYYKDKFMFTTYLCRFKWTAKRLFIQAFPMADKKDVFCTKS